MYRCDDCKRLFKTYRVRHDWVQVGEDDYEDTYVCPYCGSEDFRLIKED